MSNIIVVTSPELTRSEPVIRREEVLIARAGGRVLARVRHGTVVSGPPELVAALQKQGYQVSLYADTNRLRIAGLDIDLSNPQAGMDPSELVPADAVASWPLHIVQFAGPPFSEWVEEIEKLGARRVERAGKYGLYIHADPALTEKITQLPFVTMVHPLEPGWKLDPRLKRLPAGKVEQIDLAVFPSDAVQEVSAAVSSMGGLHVRTETPPAGRTDQGAHVVVEIEPTRALELAHLPDVRAVAWLPPVGVEGERESQIQAENLDGAAAPDSAPVTGYAAFLTGVGGIGADGTGVTVSIVDSGIDVGANNNATGHLDLRQRQVAFIDYNGVPTDQNGHGTHVAGIAIGNGATGLTEAPAPGDFLWGEGAAPGASFVGQSVAHPVNPAGGSFSIPGAPTLTTDAVTNGASVQNNSWGGSGSAQAYTSREAAYDLLVRDADAATNILEQLTIVFAAGNAGGLPETINDPAAAKNVITVGNSLTRRIGTGYASDDIRGLKGSSSRGPASGGRIKPDVVAPGTDVSSARSSACNRPAIPNTNNQYVSLSGTSMSAPHVTGACAVLIDWWRDRTGGATPSPAMLKALLINGAEDMVGGPNWRTIFCNKIQQNDRYQTAALTFVPDQAMSAGAIFTQVAGAANLANNTWFFDGNTNQVTIQVPNMNNAVDIFLHDGADWQATAFNRTQQSPDRYQSAPLTFVPVQAFTHGTFLTQVAAANNLAADTWFFDAATNRVTVQTDIPITIDLLDGTIADIPNNDQGWGRVSLRNIVTQRDPATQPLTSDRGPRLFIDQRHAFTGNGQSHTWRVQPVDTNRPMRATLVWTDAPGVINDPTPIANILNLELQDGGTPPTIWHGNPANFANGFSTPGGVANIDNNVECVYIGPATPAGIYEVIVRGATVIEDARDPGSGSPWQDYALVLENAVFASANPASVSLLLDRSGSMVASGYVDVTRATSKLFVDLLQPNDRIGVVSFSDDATDVYSDGGLVDLIDDPDVNTAAGNGIDGIPFGGCTYMGQGLQSAQNQLTGVQGNRAIVLMSDGFDNKGCHPTDATRPWAVDVAAGLPAGIDVYTCAMGPASDQITLEQIASLTGGQYYFMPTIDDLYEIYNYIRGNVSGNGVIVNTSSTASISSIPAYVDCDADQVVFACQWHAQGLNWVGQAPKRASELYVYLKTPDGKAVPSNASWVTRRTGENYVIFTVDDPRPGRWQVAVETYGDSHTRYTVGGWVQSDLQLVVSLDRLAAGAGMALANIGVQSQTGRKVDVRYMANVSHPLLSLADLVKKHKRLLGRTKPDSKALKDGVDDTIARLMAADRKLRSSDKPSIFTPVMTRLKVTRRATGAVATQPLRLARPAGYMVTAAPGAIGIVDPVNPFVLRGSVLATQPALQQAITHTVRMNTLVPGSYSLRLKASGVDPSTRCRFERYVLRCFVVA